MLEEYERIQETLKSDATRPMGGIGFVLPGMLRPKKPAGSRNVSRSSRCDATCVFVADLTCQHAIDLPTVAAFAGGQTENNADFTARTLKGSRRLNRRHDRRGASPQWQFLRGFLKHPVMVGSIIPSSRVLIDKMLRPVDWDNTKLFVEYGPGRRHIHAADPRTAARRTRRC